MAINYTWMEDVAVGQAGTCPVCRKTSKKESGRQTGCGEKRCRDAGFKMRKSGVDPKSDANPKAPGAEKVARNGKPSATSGLTGAEAMRLKAAMKAEGNPVVLDDKQRGGFVLADKTFVTYAAARQALDAQERQDREAREVDADVVLRAVRDGQETVASLAAILQVAEWKVQAVVDAGVSSKAITPAQAKRAMMGKTMTAEEIGRNNERLANEAADRVFRKAVPPDPKPAVNVGATAREKAVAQAEWILAAVTYDQAGEALLAEQAGYAERVAQVEAALAEAKALHKQRVTDLKAVYEAAQKSLAQTKKRGELLGVEAPEL